MPSNTPSSFSQLYETYNRRFIRFATGYVSSVETAEDIVCEAFMYCWEHRETIGGQNLPAYLLTVVKHKCLNHLKRLAAEEQAKSRFQSLSEWELQFKINTLESCDPEKLLSDEIQSLVRKALLDMPEQTRNIFLKSRFQRMTNKEIAERKGLTVKTVEYHIGKALKLLRIVLKDYFPAFLLLFPDFHSH